MGNIFSDAVNAAGDAVNAVGHSASEVGQDLGEMWDSAHGGDVVDQAQQQVATTQAQLEAERQNARLGQSRQGLEAGGTDPASITQHDNWANWDHPRLYAFRDTLKVEQIQESGRAWEELGKELAEIFVDLDKKTRDAAGDGMHGDAADAGLSAARSLQDWGKSFGDSVQLNGIKIQEAGVAAEQTKMSIPEPKESNTTRTVLSGLTGGSPDADAALQMMQREEDAMRARVVMKNVFTPGYDAVDTSTATLPPPNNPLKPPPPTPPPTRTDIPSSQTPNVPSQPTIPSTMDSGVSDRPLGSGYTATPPTMPSPSTQPPTLPPAESDSSWANPSHDPIFRTPGGFRDPGHGAGPGMGVVAGVPTPGVAAGGSAGGGIGSGARAAGGAGSTPPGAGGRAGAGGARTPMTGAGAGASSGASGARGAAGAGGMGAGRGQQGSEEDEEHERPSWLEEQDDVFFNDMPKIAPPVFGA